jgi:hypothetical protein
MDLGAREPSPCLPIASYKNPFSPHAKQEYTVKNYFGRGFASLEKDLTYPTNRIDALQIHIIQAVSGAS